MRDRFARLDGAWARDFGSAPDALHTMEPRVQPHAGAMKGYGGIWMLATDGSPCISIPPDIYPALSDAARSWAAVDEHVLPRIRQDIDALTRQRVASVVGPAFIGIGLEEHLQLQDAARARVLEGDVHQVVAALRAEVSSEEWEHGGSETEGPLFGVFDDTGRLATLSGYEVWNGEVAHISIVSRTTVRGMGHGRAAVALATQHALAAGLVPQYRTLYGNLPSMRIAQHLGFVEYGRSLAIRLEPA